MSLSTQQQQQQDNLKKLGNDLVQKREFAEASNFYDRALEIDSTSESSAAIFSNRSLCYLNIKRFNEALQDAEKAISLRPTWHRGYQRAAAACEKLTNRDEEGVKNLEKCFELDQAIRNDKEMKKLKQTFEINIIKQKAPSMTQDELKQIGNTFVKNQQYESAITVYTLAIEKDAFCDAAVPILSNRSMAYFKLGKFKEAYEDGGCCCGIKPDWPKGFMRRGVAAERLGAWQISLESYDEYLKLDPQDEADVKKNRDYVKRVVDTLEQTENNRKESFKRWEDKLSKMDGKELTADNPIGKETEVYKLLYEGCAEMDIDKIELAVSHGADLGKHFVSDEGLESGFFNNKVPKGVLLHSKHRFSMHDFIAAKDVVIKSEACRQSDETNLALRNVACGARFAFNFLGRLAHDLNMTEFEATDLLIKQREYFDRLLDLPNKQQHKYAPSPRVYHLMTEVCSYDAQHPIRDDLVMIMLEKGKKYFVGDNISDVEFKKLALRCILLGGRHMTSQVYDFAPIEGFDSSTKESSPSTDSSLRKLLECLQTCLKGLSPEDLDSECPSNILVHFSPNMKGLPLSTAAMTHRAPQVTQLLLDRGASVNKQQRIDTSEALSGGPVSELNPLFAALTTGNTPVCNLLLLRGAKIPVLKTPEEVHQYFDADTDSETMMVPQRFYSAEVFGIFYSLQQVGDPTKLPFGREENIRAWFDVLTNQNLSFIFPHQIDPTRFCTPLTTLLGSNASPELIKMVVKLRPKLLYTPMLYPEGGKFFPLGMVIHNLQHNTMSLEVAKSTVKVLLELGLDFFESTAVDIKGGMAMPAEQFCRLTAYHQPIELIRKIDDLNKFCTDFEEKRGNSFYKD